MTIFWTCPAEEDLAGIVTRQAERSNRKVALAVATELISAAEGLSLFASRGRPGRVAGTRELIVGHHILIYELVGSDVHVLRCLDARRPRPAP